jgi:hypothetical protein
MVTVVVIVITTVMAVTGLGLYLDSRERLYRAEVTRHHLRALRAAQRIHRAGWRARKAMADEAERRRPREE